MDWREHVLDASAQPDLRADFAAGRSLLVLDAVATADECAALRRDARAAVTARSAKRDETGRTLSRSAERVPLDALGARALATGAALLGRAVARLEAAAPGLSEALFGAGFVDRVTFDASIFDDATVGFSPGEPAVNIYVAPAGEFRPHEDGHCLTVLVAAARTVGRSRRRRGVGDANRGDAATPRRGGRKSWGRGDAAGRGSSDRGSSVACRRRSRERSVVCRHRSRERVDHPLRSRSRRPPTSRAAGPRSGTPRARAPRRSVWKVTLLARARRRPRRCCRHPGQGFSSQETCTTPRSPSSRASALFLSPLSDPVAQEMKASSKSQEASICGYVLRGRYKLLNC